ncbi:hypothetical protein [Salinarimonas soli]|uniref:DUF3298 domain-containing protein n=1 Tax=Salinarimonas soli TaxID=1638099 RepID=A0A5B2VFG9_9HYPH|nr:hypothetical protein [Salinarimonas soli]KAA2237356.1 hypothetical protein F0L46_10175 [Salinarimonas soli]
MRGPIPLIAGAAILASLPAHAQAVSDPRCPYSFETRVARPTIVVAQARVTCAVERDTGLAGRVIAEARQALGRAVGGAEAEARGKAVEARTERRFTLDVERVHLTDRVASLLSTATEREGDARPSVTPRSLTWDLDRGLYVTLGELFREPRPGGPAMTALRDAVRGALRERAPALADAIKAEPQSFRAWTLTPGADAARASGITFHYGTSERAPEGATAFVPAEVLAPHLTAARRELFGVERR